MSYLLHPEAASEHEQQVVYYQKRQRGLGQRYHSAFRTAVAMVCATPHRFKIARPPDIRKLGLRGFPFSVIYREVDGTIHVLAVSHHRRRPQYWAGRL